MSYDLPEIVFTIKLEPFVNIKDTNDKKLEKIELVDLPANIQNKIRRRIKDDYKNIISQTLSYQYKVSAYNYNYQDNIVTIDFILTPEDIKKRWIPEFNDTGLPKDRDQLLTTFRQDIVNQVDHLYTDLAKETWKKGRVVFFIDEEGAKYLIDLRLISTESFLDWSNVGKQNRLTSVGGNYYKKYLSYKSKYLSLKNHE